MRYMFLIYSRETDMAGVSPADMDALRAAHRAVMNETGAKGIFHGAEPLHPTATATTVRMQGGKPLVIDGPIGWAAKIPTACKGGEGCIEIRPIMGLPSR